MSKFKKFLDELINLGTSQNKIKEELTMFFKNVDLGYRKVIVKQATQIRSLKNKLRKKNEMELKNKL